MHPIVLHPDVQTKRAGALVSEPLQLVACRSKLAARVAALVALVACVTIPQSVGAVARSCGSDPVANTASVLCAAPSGPCTSTSVTLGANLEVTSGGCAFDLGGRSLTVTNTMQMIGTGFITVDNAGDITITSTGKLKARGDFVKINNQIIQGGDIDLRSLGRISIDGRLDVSGDGAGSVRLRARNDVAVSTGAVVQALGQSTTADDGDRYADGGTVEVVSEAGTITWGSEITVTGQNHGEGGSVLLQAAQTINLAKTIDASGGGGGGGDIDLQAGDDVQLISNLDVTSRNGGGSGGTINLTAGADELGGANPGGNVLAETAVFKLDGSSDGVGETGEGDGGHLSITAAGNVELSGTGASIRAGAGSQSAGDGGTVELAATAGTLTLDASTFAKGGSQGGRGGRISLSASQDISLQEPVELSARRGGGTFQAVAWRNIDIDGTVTADALAAGGTAGSIAIAAGANANGTLTVSQSLEATGDQRSDITLSACGLAVDGGARITGSGTTSTGGSKINLAALNSLSIGANSQVSAGPQGSITLRHPSGMQPATTGASFNPAPSDSTDGPFPACTDQS